MRLIETSNTLVNGRMYQVKKGRRLGNYISELYLLPEICTSSEKAVWPVYDIIRGMGFFSKHGMNMMSMRYKKRATDACFLRN